MSNFNDIGIPRQLDWPRVRKLLTIGVFGALLHLADSLTGRFAESVLVVFEARREDKRQNR